MQAERELHIQVPFVRMLPQCALCPHCGKLLTTCVVECYHLGEECEGLLGVTAQVGDGSLDACTCIGEGLTVGRNLILERLSLGCYQALTHNGMTDNECRLLCRSVSSGQSLANLVDIVSIDIQHLPTPSAILHCNILVVHLITLGRELNIVGIVEHNEVVES